MRPFNTIIAISRKNLKILCSCKGNGILLNACFVSGKFIRRNNEFHFLWKVYLKKKLGSYTSFPHESPKFPKGKHICECRICPFDTDRAIFRPGRQNGRMVCALYRLYSTRRPVKLLSWVPICLRHRTWSIMLSFYIAKDHSKFYVFAFMMYLSEPELVWCWVSGYE